MQVLKMAMTNAQLRGLHAAYKAELEEKEIQVWVKTIIEDIRSAARMGSLELRVGCVSPFMERIIQNVKWVFPEIQVSQEPDKYIFSWKE